MGKKQLASTFIIRFFAVYSRICEKSDHLLKTILWTTVFYLIKQLFHCGKSVSTAEYRPPQCFPVWSVGSELHPAVSAGLSFLTTLSVDIVDENLQNGLYRAAKWQFERGVLTGTGLTHFVLLNPVNLCRWSRRWG